VRSDVTFVGREHEIARLEGSLEQALSGQGQICFVTGEAGSGKTTLVNEFTRRAQRRLQDLVVARGECNAQSGLGDAYLPFREVFDVLTGGSNDHPAEETASEENTRRVRRLLRSSAEVLLELGPDLVGVFIPWAALATRLGTFAVEKAGLVDKVEKRLNRHRTPHPSSKDAPRTAASLDQDQIFEQYVKVLRALAKQQPLIVVLDDLQWADASSTSLLFHLSRRIEGVPILVIGSYRPREVALGRVGAEHPLDKVLREVKRYRGDVWIDLDAAQDTEGCEFVDQLLDAQPNLLGDEFRQTLLAHAGGNPLLIVELLRHMRDQGVLVMDEQGRWIAPPNLVWSGLPARVEGVIEERIRRLDDGQRETVTIAAVEGVEFTAEVIADVQGLRAREVVRDLSGELAKKHQLVEPEGLQHLVNRRLSRYAFRHHLFQSYVYDLLDDIERSYLHEDVGRALEELYGDEADEIAVQLAHHFVTAEVEEKARRYLRASGECAAARYANQEAVDYLSRALALTPQDDLKERYTLLLQREQVYHVQGARQAQQRDLMSVETLAEQLPPPDRTVQVALRRARFAEATSDYPQAIRTARRAIDRAQDAGDATSVARGRLQWGRAAWHQGQYDVARTQLELALDQSRDLGDRTLEGDCLSNLGIVSWYQGRFSAARDYLERALIIKRETGDRQGEAHVLTNLAGVTYEEGRHQTATARQKDALDIYRAVGYRRGEAMALCNLSVFLIEQGSYDSARSHLADCLPIYQQLNDREGETAALINLGLTALYQGQYGDADPYLEKALEQARQIGDGKGETEALIYLSLLRHQRGDDTAARTHAEQALRLAEQAGDLRSKGHALTHLGHALLGLRRAAEAEQAYTKALALRRELGEAHRAVETLAGLARSALAQDELRHATDCVEEILTYLKTASLDGTDEPIRILLTCHKVLEAQGDGRGTQVLAAAKELFENHAAHIQDPELRRSYAKNIPSHVELADTVRRA